MSDLSSEAVITAEPTKLLPRIDLRKFSLAEITIQTAFSMSTQIEEWLSKVAEDADDFLESGRYSRRRTDYVIWIGALRIEEGENQKLLVTIEYEIPDEEVSYMNRRIVNEDLFLDFFSKIEMEEPLYCTGNFVFTPSQSESLETVFPLPFSFDNRPGLPFDQLWGIHGVKKKADNPNEDDYWFYLTRRPGGLVTLSLRTRSLFRLSVTTPNQVVTELKKIASKLVIST